MDDDELMRVQAETLFTYDARGRMLRDNHEGGGAAPRLFVGRTLHGDTARFGATLPEAVAQRLAALLEREPLPAGDLRAPLQANDALHEVLAAHAPVAAHGGGPAYTFPAALAQPAGVVRVTDDNVALLKDTFPRFVDNPAARRDCLAVVRNGAAVAVCLSSRSGPRAIEAEVETLPEFRGRGYAVAVTAAWGLLVRAAGVIPLYSTSWENVASQGVARRLGLSMYGADLYWV